MGKVVFVADADVRQTMFEKARRLIKTPFADEKGVVWLADSETRWNKVWEQRLAGAAVVIMRGMGRGLESTFFKSARAFLDRQGSAYAIVAGESPEEKAYSGFSDEAVQQLSQYELYGGLENSKQLWLWLFYSFTGQNCAFAPPRQLLWHGIYHPRAAQVYSDAEAYECDFCRVDRPTIGLLFYRSEWLADNLAYQDAVIAEGERQGFNVIAVFSQGIAHEEAPKLEEALDAYFVKNGRPRIDVLINTMKFSLSASGALSLAALQRLNVPQLQAYTLLSSVETWENSIEGLSAMETSISVTLPEFDGVIHSIPISGKVKDADGMVSYAPIDERINLIIRKAGKWAALRRKAHKEKKIAIVFHNYPPKNSNIGTAFGLDSPESVRRLLSALREDGYAVDHIPADSKTFMEEVLQCATNDRRFLSDAQLANAVGRVDKQQYQKFFDTLSPQAQQCMIASWGEPIGEVFNCDDTLLIPGMLNGNVLITVQPPRGFGEDPGKIYHDPVTPPTHHYLAFYYWLRDIWDADAVVHVGTHGSLEWLPGKGAGLSRDCWPDMALGDLPNVYPYIVTIVGEGIQAKRRGAACLIDHLTPPVGNAGLYDELEELENLMESYCRLKDEPEKAAVTVRMIQEKLAEANLDRELVQGETELFEDYIGRIHAYITDIKHMQIRTGLHILGRAPECDDLREYLLALTKIANGSVPSLPQTLAAKAGYNYYELLEQSARLNETGTTTYGQLADQIWTECTAIIDFLTVHGFSETAVAEVLLLQDYAQASQDWQEELLAVCRYICTELAPALAKTSQEITNTLRALQGEYIEPAPAGAPTSGRADVLPTGRNFYGVDPRLLPTKPAWEISRKMADDMVTDYIAQEGCYPETVGIILWAGANMRTCGECIGEFLYLMGVRPIWQRGSERVIGLEAISLDELKRPRIDVVGRISGLLRDSMPSVVSLLDQAAKLAASLDETHTVNFVRKHVEEETKALVVEGVDSEKAKRLASLRVFGCPPGGYGAGVANVLEEKNWETVDDLAQVYVRWGAHAYGGSAHGDYVPDAFKRRLSTIDVTIHNEDNREISLLNSDDFNSYQGGMIAAVRSLRGKAPQSYCGDSTDKSRVVTRTLQQEVKRLFRGEAINPKFIEGMKKHGYKGAADLANYVAHSYQWDATSEVMEDWMYEQYARKYAFDADMQAWMKDVNPWALQRIAETLLEAHQRGMWNTTEDTIKSLQNLYLSIEGDLEERSDS